MKLYIALLCLFVSTIQAVKWGPIRNKKPLQFQNIKDTPISERITGGTEATPGQFPYHAGIILDGVALCGASLISSTTVLTAGHCVKGFLTFEVNLGAHNIYDYEEPGRISVVSRDVKFHEEFNVTAFSVLNDIGLVRMTEPVVLSPTIQIVRLPRYSQANENIEGVVGTFSGWGVYNESINVMSPVLNYGYSTVISNNECALYFPENFIIDNVFCTFSNVTSNCDYDSGGPIVMTEDDGMITQIGITSFASSAICGAPNGFTRITSHLDWIAANSDAIIQP